LYETIEEFTLYGMDILPSVTWETYWRALCIGLVIDGILKFAIVGELFSHLVAAWPAVAKLGNRLISGTGVILVLLATLAAAYAPIDNPQHAIISREHILEQTLYIIQCGLVLFLFLFAAYFHLSWNHRAFGILLSFAILFCERMAVWAVAANGLLFEKRQLLGYANMATYHACVLIWFYYLLVPEKKTVTSAVLLPEHNLGVWNRELERLLQP
jgi:ABC-type xylose transport system permease subunit